LVAGAFTLDGDVLRSSGPPPDAGRPDDPKGGGKAAPRKAEPPSWPLARVRAFLTSATPPRLLLASRPDDPAAAVVAIARARAAAGLVALVPAALEAGDAALARRALVAAAERGAPQKDLERVEPSIAAAEAKAPSRDESKAADVEARVRALLGAEADVLVESASSIPDSAP